MIESNFPKWPVQPTKTSGFEIPHKYYKKSQRRTKKTHK